MKELEHWQVETFAGIHELTFPPPEWSTADVERAARPTIWVEVTSLQAKTKGRPTVCPMPVRWAFNWMEQRAIDFMHLPQFDAGFVGIGIFPKSQPCLIYDKEVLIGELLDEVEDHTLAVSLFEYKLSKAYYGRGSPGFLTGFSY